MHVINVITVEVMIIIHAEVLLVKLMLALTTAHASNNKQVVIALVVCHLTMQRALQKICSNNGK
jgi:RNase P/RNase MRP subunit POP5